MKKFAVLLLFALSLFKTPAQDIRNMTPAQLEAYKKKMMAQQSKQIKALAEKGNIKIDELSLPDAKIQLPPKDLRRLAALPKQPPTLIQLSDNLRRSKAELEKLVQPAVLEEVKAITSKHSPEEQHTAAVAAFYADKPEQSLLISMQSVLQRPDEVMGWNNLASFLTMNGLEHKAIPILMHHLEKNPGNSMLLNNMGQAYLGLGDIGLAENYLKQCLAADPSHPEANRSMGMIRFFYNQYEEGMSYFEKELTLAYRRSTIALMRSKNKNANLVRLRKNKGNLPGKDYFGQLQMALYKMPSFPATTDETRMRLNEAEGFLQSVTREMLYWMHKTELSDEERAADGRKSPGLYADYVEKLLEDLQVVYPSEELALFSQSDLHQIEMMIDDYGAQMGAVQCPVAPAGVSGDMYKAYIQKCCAIKKPIMDEFVGGYNAFVESRIRARIPVWKEYINDLINIVSLAPNAGNRVMVYAAIKEYFVFLQLAWQSGQFLDPPMECSVQLDPSKTDSLIEASHNLDLNCPAWLNIEVDFTVAKLKADCEKYAIEGGTGLQAGFERSFKTGTTTLSAGVGVKAKFFAANGSAELKQMVYASFDANGFNEFGLLGKAGVKIGDNPIQIGGIKAGGTLAAVEGGYTLGMHSGFKSYVKGKGALADWVKVSPLP